MKLERKSDEIYSRPLAIAFLVVALLCAGVAGAEADHGAWWPALWSGLLAASFAWRALKALTPPWFSRFTRGLTASRARPVTASPAVAITTP